MTNWEDYYKILGVGPEATTVEIRAAWRRKALDLHPDRLSQASEVVRHSSEEELKRVNRAYEVLIKHAKRRSYHAEWLRSNSPPKPVLEPSVIVFGDAEPGVSKTASFVIRNDGGVYQSIWFSDPDSWLKVTGYASLQPDDELPLQVEITASGHGWGEHYTERIAVRLDGVEAAVRVQLHTRPAPSPPRPLGWPAWAKWAVASGAVALAIIIGIADTGMPEHPDSPGVQSRSSGSNFLGTQPRPSGFQARSPVTQPRPSGPQFGSPGIQPASSGFRPSSPGVQTRPTWSQPSSPVPQRWPWDPSE